MTGVSIVHDVSMFSSQTSLCISSVHWHWKLWNVRHCNTYWVVFTCFPPSLVMGWFLACWPPMCRLKYWYLKWRWHSCHFTLCRKADDEISLSQLRCAVFKYCGLGEQAFHLYGLNFTVDESPLCSTVGPDTTRGQHAVEKVVGNHLHRMLCFTISPDLKLWHQTQLSTFEEESDGLKTNLKGWVFLCVFSDTMTVSGADVFFFFWYYDNGQCKSLVFFFFWHCDNEQCRGLGFYTGLWPSAHPGLW